MYRGCIRWTGGENSRLFRDLKKVSSPATASNSNRKGKNERESLNLLQTGERESLNLQQNYNQKVWKSSWGLTVQKLGVETL